MQGVWIVFTAGAMGSGKTHTLRWLWQKGYFPLHAFVQGDPDRVRGMLPELPGYVERCPEVCLAGTARVELSILLMLCFQSAQVSCCLVDVQFGQRPCLVSRGCVSIRHGVTLVCNGQSAGEKTHKEAGCVAEILTEAALNRSLSAIVDGSLQDVQWHAAYIKVSPGPFYAVRCARAALNTARRPLFHTVAETSRAIPRRAHSDIERDIVARNCL
jgi:hypothetical protein